MDQTVTCRHTISRAPWFGQGATAPTAPWEICYPAALGSSQTLGSLLSFTFLELEKEPVVTFINSQEFSVKYHYVKKERDENCSIDLYLIQLFKSFDGWIKLWLTDIKPKWPHGLGKVLLRVPPTAPWEIPMLCLKGPSLGLPLGSLLVKFVLFLKF